MALQNLENEVRIGDYQSFVERLASGKLSNCNIRDLDFRNHEIDWAAIEVSGAVFLGCQFRIQDEFTLRERGAFIFPKLPGILYNPFRAQLYSWQELMEGWMPGNDQSLDLRIYRHFSRAPHNPGISEALSQRIHDYSVDVALRTLLDMDNDGISSRKCVGIMGGHGTPRTDEFYQKVAITARLLSGNGYFVVSGGGPGIMEAANLGAWFSAYRENELKEAIEMMSFAPVYTSPGYFESARNVLQKWPDGNKSLAIPTWFYGHEPSNLFATAIAKYFSNSIREDTLLAICLHGIIFAPGSAGTTQEIFQDAAQNHYGTFDYHSPMIFMGRKRFESDTLIFPLIRQLSQGKKYHDLIFLTDHPSEILDFVVQHPPVKRGN